MKKLLTAALLTLSLSAASALAEPLDAFKGLSGTLDIAGGTAHIPVMKKAAQNIMSAYPDIRISVAGGGSGVGVKQVGEGLAAIGNTGRPLKDEEISKYGKILEKPVYKRNCLQNINTRKLTYEQRHSVKPSFDELINYINATI